jgi:hypothetical protein
MMDNAAGSTGWGWLGHSGRTLQPTVPLGALRDCALHRLARFLPFIVQRIQRFGLVHMNERFTLPLIFLSCPLPSPERHPRLW